MRYILLMLLFISCKQPSKQPTVTKEAYNEKYRSLIHFSPKANWMNDPNGLVYYNGTYHLFFQYYPDSTVWGPMHWGHATSTDLVHWVEHEIALYPDSLGYIFSGSAVVDSSNTTGFGQNGKIPLVAMFTYHDTAGEKAGRENYQTQGLAYSLDEGKTWTKYGGNPVLKNPGIKDFRDPKVMWYEKGKKWILTLATKDRITFYSAPDLRNWTKVSEFGADLGAHGGVWECPDLFSFTHKGDTIWVLLVSINPGGPNGGSATQYFTGKFDGKKFVPDYNGIRWLDHGPDNYAGVTWSNVGNRRLFIGWMSNWLYGQVVPTSPWRSAMTVPRDLSVELVNGQNATRSTPAKELEALQTEEKVARNVDSSNGFGLFSNPLKISGPVRLQMKSTNRENFTVTLKNDKNEKLLLFYDKEANEFIIDRSQSGKLDFEKSFGGKYKAPRIAIRDSIEVDLIIDRSSIEVFADGGLTVMTAIYFPSEDFSYLTLSSPALKVSELRIFSLKSIWP